jgi:hypothetical protein
VRCRRSRPSARVAPVASRFFFRSPLTRTASLFARAARQGAPQGRGGRAHVAREDGQLPAEVEHVQVIGVRA